MKRITRLKVGLNLSLIDTQEYMSFVYLIKTDKNFFDTLTIEEISKLRNQHFYISHRTDHLIISFTEKHPMFNIGNLLEKFIFTHQYAEVRFAVYEFLKSLKYV